MRNALRFGIACSWWLMAAAFPARAGLVSGAVRTTSGTILPGMTVQAYAADGSLTSQTITSGSGFWSLSLGAGAYRLVAFDPSGFYATDYYNRASSFDTSSSVTVGDCPGISGVDFALAISGFLTGTVSDATTFKPASGITVGAYNIEGSARGSTKTDAQGQYRLAVPPGSYRIAAFDNARRYVTQFFRTAGDFGSATTLAVTSSQVLTSLDFALPYAGVVAGTVRDGKTGVPLAGRTVQLYAPAGEPRSRATSASNGTYAVATPPGEFKVVASDPASAYRSVVYPDGPSFDGAPTLRVVAGQTVGDVDFALPAATSPTSVELFVVAAAHAGGVNGTFFTTSLDALNLSSSRTAHVSFTWLATGGGDNSGAAAVNREIPPGTQVVVPDAVATLFGTSGGGAIRILSDLPLVVSTRTATPAPGSGGSFGLGIPGLGVGRTALTGWIGGITVDSSFRTNVGFLNPGTVPVTIAFTLVGESGTPLATGSVALAPLGQFQANTIASYLGIATPVRNASLRAQAPSPFFAYATVIDQSTGDATFVEAQPE